MPSAALRQQARELIGVQALPADYETIEQQHRDFEPVTAPEEGIGIDIHHLERRQRQAASEARELGQHLITQLALAPVHECQAPASRYHAQRPAGGPCAFS